MFRHIFINQSEIYSTDLIDYIFTFVFVSMHKKRRKAFIRRKDKARMFTRSHECLRGEATKNG